MRAYVAGGFAVWLSAATACYMGVPLVDETADEVGESGSSGPAGTQESGEEPGDEGESSSTTDDGESSSTTDESEASDDPSESVPSSDSLDGTDTTDWSDDGDSESTSDEGPIPDMGMAADPNEQIPPPDEEGCHAIYAQDEFPTFELEIVDPVWDSLVDLWNNGKELEEEDVETKLDFPLKEFRYGDIVIHDATIRLRGNPEFWDPLPDDKLQFQIDFDQNDEDGHFLGLKKLAFDAATANRSMLRDRLALSVLRDVGITATCANHAKLYINGEYYGVFTNLEKLDEVFLERAFEDPTGDLWKRANWTLKTNLDTSDADRLEDLNDADSIAELEDYLDLEQTLLVYAAGAVLPDSDGPWAGGLNFYLYDEPISGKFMMLPWDLDGSFDRFDGPPGSDFPNNPDPVVWEKKKTHGRPWYDMALQDPEWFDYYIEQIEYVVDDGYDPDDLQDRIEEWTEQIEDAVLDDPNKPFSNAVYYEEVDDLHDFVEDRYDFLVEWLSCWESGGIADIEGYCVTP